MPAFVLLTFFLFIILSLKDVYGCSAAFNVDNTSPVVGETVTFNSTDSQGNSCSWNFGADATPGTSTSAGPIGVIYSQPGDKTVSLRVSWLGGSDTESKIINVGLPPTAGAIGSDQTINKGDTPSALTSVTDGGGSGTISYEWQTDAGGSYATIGGATSAAYQPPALTSTTRYQRRTAAVYGGVTRYSGYTSPVTITTLDPVTFTTSYTNITCNGSNNGKITISVDNPSGSYEYSLDNGNTYPYSGISPKVIEDLSPGTYIVRVRTLIP